MFLVVEKATYFKRGEKSLYKMLLWVISNKLYAFQSCEVDDEGEISLWGLSFLKESHCVALAGLGTM